MKTDGATNMLSAFLAQGKKTFSATEVTAMKGGDRRRAYKVITRLLWQKRIMPLAHGFYVIFSPSEFESQRCAANDVIDQLMQYKQADYYVGLLSAALHYGAAHYRPMVFQVVSNKRILQPIKQATPCTLQIHFKKAFPTQCIQKINGQYGYINYSSVALTMYDLLKYENHVGGIENIILVIKELLPELTQDDLDNLLAEQLESAYLQRLGYLLDKLDASALSGIIRNKICLSSVYLRLSRLEASTGTKNKKWRIIDNANWDEVYDTYRND